MSRRDADRAGRAGKLVCPHCIEPIGEGDDFCPHCGRPVTSFASTDPARRGLAMGRPFGGAVRETEPAPCPRIIVVGGLWLLLGVQIPFLIAGILDLWPRAVGDAADGATRPALKLILFAGLILVYVAILWRVTVRRPKPSQMPDEEKNAPDAD